MAEFERNLIRERTLGPDCCPCSWPGGWPQPKLNDKQIRDINILLADPATQVKESAERYGMSPTTLHKRVGVLQRQQRRAKRRSRLSGCGHGNVLPLGWSSC